MLNLKYANEDKSLSAGGWILDYDFLKSIENDLLSLETYYCSNIDKETIELVLLIGDGEKELIKERLTELEDFWWNADFIIK